MSITKASLIDLNGQELILDADADTSITADTDDQIDIKIAGSDSIRIKANEIENVSGDFTLDVVGDITLDAAGDQINFHSGGTARGYIDMSTGGLILRSLTSDADIILQGTDDSSSVNAITLDMSAAGKATFNAGIVVNESGGDNNTRFEGENLTSLIDIDASTDRIGFGTGSPAFPIHASFTDSIVAVIDSDNDSGTFLFIRNSDATTGRTANLGFAPANNIEGARIVAEAIEDFSTSANRTADIAFQVRHNGTMAERWRIHSDGAFVSQAQTPVAIGGTPADANFTELGSGYINLARDDTADADQVLFAKNGAIHTKLKTISGAFVIDSASGNVHLTANSNSLNYNGTTLKPFDSDDNLIDLGTSGARYKDLYLSGGLFIGGTGSDNKLDDYEVGTWTPSVNAGSISGTSITYQGAYTKVGRMVFISLVISSSSADLNVSSYVQFSGVPFTITYRGTGTVITEDIDQFDRQGFAELGSTFLTLSNCGSSSGTGTLTIGLVGTTS